MRRHPSGRCQQLLERLQLYVDGELTPREHRALVAHLRRCPCCEEFAQSLERTVAACRQAGLRRLPSDVRARARARIAELMRD